MCDELAKDTCTAGAFAHPAFLKDEHIRGVKSKLLFVFKRKSLILTFCGRASVSLLFRD